MKILRLVIHSFGDLRNKIVDFSEDTNVIMGTSAETINTIEKFIDGMLFGLSNEDKKRYLPMRLPFTGTLEFLSDTEDPYQIDRNFLNDSFNVTDMDGNDVTEDFTDEFGSLAILPVTDSIYAKETFDVPEVTEKDKNKLKDLKTRRRILAERYNIDNLIPERDALSAIISEQEEIEQKIQENKEEIARNEAQIQKINGSNEAKENEINTTILKNKSRIQEINLEIERLKDKSNSSGTGKAQILKRDVKNAGERLEVIDKKVQALETEEKTRIDQLDELRNKFTLDRKELKQDYESYQQGLKQTEREQETEPLVTRLMDFSSWLYGVLILVGLLAICIVLYNPNDTLTRPPIYFISFISCFVVLSSCVIIYLQYKNHDMVPVTQTAYKPGLGSEKIIQKYNKSSQEEFESFFNDYKQVYNRMDSLESEIDEIRDEIKDARQEKEELQAQERNISIELQKNKTSYENKETEEEIINLSRERNELTEEIERLVKEREDLQENSIWKLRERSYILNEQNRELMSQNTLEDLTALKERYNRLQRRIDHYNQKAARINEQIERIENSSQDTRLDYINSFAMPGEADYDEKIAQQFNFGLQQNLKDHQDVPYITFNPFSGNEEIGSDLMEKFKLFIENNQTLIFTTELDDLDRLRSNKINYNGIFIK